LHCPSVLIVAQITTYTLRNGAVRAVREEENLYAAIDLAADKVRYIFMGKISIIPPHDCGGIGTGTAGRQDDFRRGPHGCCSRRSQ